MRYHLIRQEEGNSPKKYPTLNDDDVNHIIESTFVNSLEQLLSLEVCNFDDYDIIGTFCDGKYTVLTITYDGGDKPHFHVVDTETFGEKFETCIYLTKSKYYKHNGFENGKLTSKELESLDNMLRKKNNYSNHTLWEIMVFGDYLNNKHQWRKNRKRLNLEQPNYKNTNDYQNRRRRRN